MFAGYFLAIANATCNSLESVSNWVLITTKARLCLPTSRKVKFENGDKSKYTYVTKDTCSENKFWSK